tara:strand:+ start:982 stop:1581 length:600 start_codon:yes stop_codon:yes gene_type:complete
MLFISHTWKNDEENRRTHNRAMLLVKQLRKDGWSVWFDEDNLKYGNIDAAMADGIEQSSYFIMLLTKKYIDKVNNGCKNVPINDNCAKEFNCALVRGKPIIPMIFELAVKDVSKWSSGVLTLFFANNMHIYALDDDWCNYSKQINVMIKNIPKNISKNISRNIPKSNSLILNSQQSKFFHNKRLLNKIICPKLLSSKSY